MPDEFALRRDQERARNAKALVDSPLLKEAFETLEQAYIEAWKRTQATDMISREKLFLAVNQVSKVRDHLIAVISKGQMAKAELDKIERDFERKKKFGII